MRQRERERERALNERHCPLWHAPSSPHERRPARCQQNGVPFNVGCGPIRRFGELVGRSPSDMVRTRPCAPVTCPKLKLSFHARQNRALRSAERFERGDVLFVGHRPSRPPPGCSEQPGRAPAWSSCSLCEARTKHASLGTSCGPVRYDSARARRPPSFQLWSAEDWARWHASKAELQSRRTECCNLNH